MNESPLPFSSSSPRSLPVCGATSSVEAVAPVSCAAPTAAAPVWAKLVVSGNQVTCFYAKGTASPTTWTQVGPAETINFVNNPLLVGMYITSHNTPTVSTGTIDNFSITPAPTYRLADCDIGAPALMGSANLISGVWTLTGSGADVWGHLRPVQFPILAGLGRLHGSCAESPPSPPAACGKKIGIMVRDGFNSGSDYAMFCATPSEGVDFQCRTTFNNNPDKTEFVVPPAPGTVSSNTIGYGQTGSTSYVLRP